MRRTIPFAIALVVVTAGAWGAGIGKFDTTMSFEPGVTIYPEDAHAEGHFTVGFGTGFGKLYMWTGLGGVVKLQGTATELLYPWMFTVVSVEALSLGSGALSLRPQVTVPWSALSYKIPGPGLIAHGDIRLGGSGDQATRLILQAEINYYPPLLGNPWYAAALAAGGVDVGSSYWQLQYGGYAKVRFPIGLTVGIDARIASDNTAYWVAGIWGTMPSADIAAIVELPGFAIRAGIVLNGWNQRAANTQYGYVVLPNLSIVLGEIPFFM